jgi:hypothetical protein
MPAGAFVLCPALLDADVFDTPQIASSIER